MKNIISCIIICISMMLTGAKAQVLSTSNQPSQTSSRSRIAAGPSVYGVFAGRTPCREFMKDLNMGERMECAKRKMGITLYQDSITHDPTTYETWGMGKWTGIGKWKILKGTPTDPQATIFQIILDEKTSLFLLKGDENVLFILDHHKDFLVGNAEYSYTLNRARN